MIRVNNSHFSNKEKEYLNECIETGWLSSEGPFVKLFEKNFAAKLGLKHALTAANGTAALELALAALKIGPGDEVILPTFTIISCAAAVIRCGAKPVLVDIDPVTWNMNALEIEKKINSRTRAIMAVHIYGLPCDMYSICDIAHRHKLFIIEDCAELLGQTYGNKPCGSFGDISTFSFYANKHIATGEGGMLACNSDDLAARISSLRNLCFEPGRRFIHNELGWNYRMTNLQAAVGLAQLEVLDETVKRKREVGYRYYEAFKDIPEIEITQFRNEYSENIYWVFGLVLQDSVKMDAQDFMSAMEKKGIECRPFFWCMHEQPVFEEMKLFTGEKYPYAERIARRGLYIPSGTAIKDDEINHVIASVKKLLLT